MGQGTAHLITQDSNSPGDRRTSYAYTDEGWLKSATNVVLSNPAHTAAKWSYCYDAMGNRTGSTTSLTAACPTDATYDGPNQQLTGPNGTAASYTFDTDGYETGSGTGLNAGVSRTSTWTNRDQNTSNTTGGTTLLSAYIGAGNADARSRPSTPPRRTCCGTLSPASPPSAPTTAPPPPAPPTSAANPPAPSPRE